MTACWLALCAAMLLSAAAAHALAVNVWEAGTCEARGCTYKSVEEHHEQAFTQAAGHPEWGITSFEVNAPGGKPEEQVKRIRVDVPEGLAANAQALPSCSRADFFSSTGTATCTAALAEVGETEITAALEAPLLGAVDTENSGKVFNLTPEPGHPLLFGIVIEPAGALVKPIKLLLEGYVSWAFEPALAARGIPSGDFHEWFEINNVPREAEAEILGIKVANAKLSTIKSKLLFKGRAGGHFLTLPSACSATTTSYLELDAYEGGHATAITHTPVGVDGCGAVPFKPTVAVAPSPSQYDSPDGATTTLRVPQSDGINTADIRDAHVVLPEGLTLNPSAANGLQACTQAQLAKGSSAPVTCPAASKIGTALIETALPAKSLGGNVYLGKTNAPGPITGPPYLIFIDAESVYGVSVRLEGAAVPNPSTGRLEVSFLNNPQLPFSELVLTLNGGPRAPLANPVTCGAASTNSLFTPYTGGGPALPSSPFATTGCPSPLPFEPSQSTSETSKEAGAFTSFTFNLARSDSDQNLSSVQTVLPAGLVGLIPSVKLCPEPAASTGSCPSSSAIGKATAAAGVGTEPIGFSGPVYLTGPTGGAPYGLSIPIEAAAGPFDLGRVLTRVAISVDERTGRVIATATLPRIVGGVPLHLRSLSVAITKSSFMFNPTSCGPLSTNSSLGAIQGAAAAPASPFGVGDCSSLAFKPSFTAASPSVPSRANGASLLVSYTQPDHEANIRSVFVQLPKQLPSRQSTLRHACLESLAAAGLRNCPATSKVGSATVTTPVLPEKLSGPAYLVSHGGAEFPNLDVLLEGDHGVRVLLEGDTHIAKGITTSTFGSVPDVPVSKFELDLPVGPNSALGAYGSLCSQPLYMPLVVTAQSGTQLKRNLRISIGSCKIKLLGHHVRGHTLFVRVETFTAGRVSVTSWGVHPVYRRVGGPGLYTIKAGLSRRARGALAAGRGARFRVRVGFNPPHKGEYHSAAFATVAVRH